MLRVRAQQAEKCLGVDMRINHAVKPDVPAKDDMIHPVIRPESPLTEPQVVRKQIMDALLNTEISYLCLMVAYYDRVKPIEYEKEVARLTGLDRQLKQLLQNLDTVKNG